MSHCELCGRDETSGHAVDCLRHSTHIALVPQPPNHFLGEYTCAECGPFSVYHSNETARNKYCDGCGGLATFIRHAPWTPCWTAIKKAKAKIEAALTCSNNPKVNT